MENRRVLVGDARQLIEPAAGQGAEAVEMRRQPPMIGIGQIKRQQIAQASIDLIKIQARAVARNVVRATGKFQPGCQILDRANR
jgi:hypothetical protein